MTAQPVPEGFAYRILYIDPYLVQDALGGRSPPFVRNPIVDLAARQSNALSAVWEMERVIDDVGRTDVRRRSRRHCGLLRVRSLIAARPADRHPVGELERVADLDRWSLVRQFRAAFGTSPCRFRTLRQLDRVRRLLMSGSGLADAALQAGFADQSHMSRQFKRAYGLTPARWAAALR